MISPLPTVFLVTLHGIALCGFTSNGFIAAVIGIEWVKSRSLNSNELLLLSLGISNICCTASVIAVIYREHFNFRNRLTFQVTNIFLSIAVLSRFWFTAWLCVFYCVKIVNSTHSLFLWCKQRILWLLPWIVVASAVISVLSSVALQLDIIHLRSNTTTANITDMDKEESETPLSLPYQIFYNVIGASCPLLVVLLCSIAIVASLYRHVCQMRGKESSFRNPQTEAHFKAAGTVLSLLFLYLSFYIIQILPSVKAVGNKVVFYVYCVVLLVYSFVQPVILMLVNTRLKQALTQIFPKRKS